MAFVIFINTMRYLKKYISFCVRCSKLAAYDECSNVVVHVALDNTVVIEDIGKISCYCLL